MFKYGLRGLKCVYDRTQGSFVFSLSDLIFLSVFIIGMRDV